MNDRKYKVIDLFAGAGGFALGFHQAGFSTILAVEKESSFAETFRTNFDCLVIDEPIEQVLANGGLDVKADVVIGGPPCQGFSNLTLNKKDDPRRALWTYFIDIVGYSECNVFLMENVPNLITSPEGKAIIKKAEELGFWTDKKVLLASNFGVHQNRRRAFIVGSRLGPISLPKGNGERVTVRKAIGDLPPEPDGKNWHIGRNPTQMSIERYKCIPPGGNRFDLQRKRPDITPRCWLEKKSGGTDLFGRLEWDEPARCTIRTEFFKPEKGRYLHPSEDRPITHREAARLQTFPDNFVFRGSKIEVAIQIGNAVPPKLAKALAEHIREHLEQSRRNLAPQ